VLALLIWVIDWVGKDPSVEGHVGAERLGVFYPRGVSCALSIGIVCSRVIDFVP
jgi:hypothetical protein